MLAALALLALPLHAQAPAEEGPDPLRRLRRLVETHEASGEIVVRGKDGWLFYRPELRFLSVGRFWGEDAAKVSRSVKPENADPLAAIVDFDRQLDRVGVELIVVPVPPKALVYGDFLPGEGDPVAEREGCAWGAFLDELRAQDVGVVDLVPPMLEAKGKASPSFCKTDTHWSGWGADLAAFQVSWVLHEAGFYKGPQSIRVLSGIDPVEIHGDLRELAGDPSLPVEEVNVFGPVAKLEQPFDRASPILLIGDSHLLVFSVGGDMHAEGAGFGEHLAGDLFRPVDRIGVRGSGVVAPRVDLLRRKDDLAGQEVVVWVFAARDLTEAESGWPKVPVVREPK